MSQLRCSRCGADNEVSAGAFCGRCGTKLADPAGDANPFAFSAGPPPVPAPGGYDELKDPYEEEDSPSEKAAKKKASGTLFGVAALQLVCGVAVIMAFGALDKGVQGGRAMAVMTFVTMGTAVVFGALGFWAMHQPVPASIIGFILYITLSLIDFGLMVAAGAPPSIVAIGIRIAIAAALAQGMRAALDARPRYRRY